MKGGRSPLFASASAGLWLRQKYTESEGKMGGDGFAELHVHVERSLIYETFSSPTHAAQKCIAGYPNVTRKKRRSPLLESEFLLSEPHRDRDV